MTNLFSYITSSFLSVDWLLQLELFFRIVLAGFCGCLVGFERKSRGKGAGIRTHTIVAIASCLLMILSQYGFTDFFKNYSHFGIETKLDPSRIGAQIVSGIGFLGAGMIFIQKRTVTGLTTAAGIWATAGIGMSFAVGMYFISIMTTLVIIFVQILFHKKIKLFHQPTELELTFTVSDESKAIDKIISNLAKHDIITNELEFNRTDDGHIEIYIDATTDADINKVELLEDLHSNPEILSAKM